MSAWLTAALQLLANVTGFAKNKQEQNNTPKMADRAEAQKEIKAVETTNAAVKRRDLDALRREGAE
jgi:hypothetical protein